VLNFIATDLQLYEIFNIMRVSCFWHTVYYCYYYYYYLYNCLLLLSSSPSLLLKTVGGVYPRSCSLSLMQLQLGYEWSVAFRAK